MFGLQPGKFGSVTRRGVNLFVPLGKAAFISSKNKCLHEHLKAVINKQKAFESRVAAAIGEAKAVLRAEIGLARSAF